MSRPHPLTSFACALLVAVTPAMAETQASSPDRALKPPEIQVQSDGFFSRLTRPYRPAEVPPISLGNSNRADSLLRAGKLYLSLQDAIALALENNLDIELQRYGPQMAEANILRARAGGFIRGVSTPVQQGPSSAQGSGQQSGISSSAATQVSSAGAGGGAIISQTGAAIPNLEPTIVGRTQWMHNTTPQTSSFITGTNAFVMRDHLSNLAIQQGFLTGTNIGFGYSDSLQTTNSIRNDFNPARSGSLSLNITQRLLQGFGTAVNNRQIRIARNQREVSDLQFKQQVITTVSTVADLYWDLVSFNEDVKVKKQALALNEKLYSDNKKQVEIGTLAPIEIVRAEAEVARAQQDLTISETRVLQQETILKSYLNRTGVASPALAEARVIPTDRIRMPDQEPIEPLQDMVANAFRARPELTQRRINVQNAKINLKGSRSELLPSVDAFVSLANNGLAGSINTVPVPPQLNFFPATRTVSPFFLGGYSTLFSQIFSRNFPDYAAGFQVNIPLRNRAAQADMILDQLTLRQTELGVQQLENQVRVDVQNAIIGLQQARASYQAATKARILQEQTLDAEQKKYALGASTIYNVILVQRDLAQAQSADVAALSAYSKARVELDRATGETLRSNSISLEEAFRGQVKRAPAQLPVLEQ